MASAPIRRVAGDPRRHEAVALADRVLVLESGAVVYQTEISEPRRPHGTTSTQTEHHRIELLGQLGVHF